MKRNPSMVLEHQRVNNSTVPPRLRLKLTIQLWWAHNPWWAQKSSDHLSKCSKKVFLFLFCLRSGLCHWCEHGWGEIPSDREAQGEAWLSRALRIHGYFLGCHLVAVALRWVCLWVTGFLTSGDSSLLPCDLYTTCIHLHRGLWGSNSGCRNSEMSKIISERGPSPSGTSRPALGGRCPGEMSRSVWCQGNCKSYYLWGIYYMPDMA